MESNVDRICFLTQAMGQKEDDDSQFAGLARFDSPLNNDSNMATVRDNNDSSVRADFHDFGNSHASYTPSSLSHGDVTSLRSSLLNAKQKSKAGR